VLGISEVILVSLPWACWSLCPLSMQSHCRIAHYDCCLVECVGNQKFVVICTKVKYQWHFIKCVRKALLLLPVNVVCITMSLIKTVSILMKHAKNTRQPWMSWAYGQRINSWPINQIPRGIHEQVENGLHPSFRVNLLLSAVSSTAIHFTLMLLLVVVTILTHTHTLYISVRNQDPICTCL
jgi:hypothetical protein